MMDIEHFRRLTAFFDRFQAAINAAKTDDDFGAAFALFDDPLYLELDQAVQDELHDHFNRARAMA
jgi:hypothetical protein